MAKNIAIVTAKANSKSIENKNLIPVAGKPFLSHMIDAAKNAQHIDHVFVATNGEPIKSEAEKHGVGVIMRPPRFDEDHGGAIKFSIEEAEKILEAGVDIVTVLLGNTVAASSKIIDLSIRILNKDRDIDSVMTVWQAQDDHPFRALTLTGDGHLKSFLGIKSGTTRQSYPPVYFYDQGVWTFRRATLEEDSGPNPWWWMGKRCFPIVRNWVTGRDIHTPLDIAFSEYWLMNSHHDEILNKDEIDRLLQE